MKTQRFILTYTGRGTMPTTDLAFLNEHVPVLDHSRRSLLVEDAPEHIRHLLRSMPRWQYRPERMYQPLRQAGSLMASPAVRRVVIMVVVLALFSSFPLSCIN